MRKSIWLAVVVLSGCFSPERGVSPDAVADYIRHNLPLTVRTGSSDATHLDVPKPFTVPCADDVFQDLFYWDTYFANLALLRMDMSEQARNNAEDIASLIDRYGYAEDARRIAGKFRRTVEKTFADTGLLWEKYDVRTGGVSVSKEYATPSMLGWTAGVYVACGDGEDLTNVGLNLESHEKERKTQHE